MWNQTRCVNRQAGILCRSVKQSFIVIPGSVWVAGPAVFDFEERENVKVLRGLNAVTHANQV